MVFFQVAKHLRGRILFSQEATYTRLTNRITKGATIKTTSLTEEFDYQAFQEEYNKKTVPLFIIDSNNKLTVFTSDSQLKPKPGQKLVSLIG